MQEKRTLYLAGKITGDPYYFTKFYNAQKKLEEAQTVFLTIRRRVSPPVALIITHKTRKSQGRFGAWK